jgi:4-hydroxybenzoate polyprenyltransferase
LTVVAGRGGWRLLVTGLVRLTRYREYVLFVIVTTLLGAQVSGARPDWRLPLVLLANWLAVGFAFMFNDVEDAPDDALNPAKAQRNPVSAGALSLPVAYGASFSMAMLAAVAYFFLGPLPFVLGLLCLALGILYSWMAVRLKSIPVLDLVCHGLLLAGLQYWCAYFAFAPRSGFRWIAPFICVVAISLYGELFNEVRDLDGDRRAGVTHTAALVGERAAHLMMCILLGLAGLSLAYMILTGMMPLWAVGVFFALGMIFVARPLLRADRSSVMAHTGALQQPVLLLGSLTLIIWLLGSLIG